MTKRKFLGEFEQVVLLAVARMRGEGYGTSLRREIEARSERKVSIGAIYATLERLEEKRYLTSREGDSIPERGGRAPRLFTITRAGSKALLKSREMLEGMWEGIELDAASGGGQEVA